MGLSPTEFWRLTPRELGKILRAAERKRRVDELIMVNAISAIFNKHYKPIFEDDG